MVAQNTATTGVSRAHARCIGALSLAMRSASRSMTATSVARSVRPARTVAPPPARRTTSSAIPCSACAPSTTMRAPASRRARATPAKPSGCQRLVAQTDPGASPTSGPRPSGTRFAARAVAAASTGTWSRGVPGLPPKGPTSARLRSTSWRRRSRGTRSWKRKAPRLSANPTRRGIPAAASSSAVRNDRWGDTTTSNASRRSRRARRTMPPSPPSAARLSSTSTASTSGCPSSRGTASGRTRTASRRGRSLARSAVRSGVVSTTSPRKLVWATSSAGPTCVAIDSVTPHPAASPSIAALPSEFQSPRSPRLQQGDQLVAPLHLERDPERAQDLEAGATGQLHQILFRRDGTREPRRPADRRGVGVVVGVMVGTEDPLDHLRPAALERRDEALGPGDARDGDHAPAREGVERLRGPDVAAGVYQLLRTQLATEARQHRRDRRPRLLAVAHQQRGTRAPQPAGRL